MATPQWQPGELYPPGSLVVPRTAPPTVPSALQNPSWETGNDTGWDVDILSSAGSVFIGVRNKDPRTGTYIFALDASSGSATVEALNQEQPGVAAGRLVTFRMWMRRSGNPTASGKVILRWYDSGGTAISTSEGAAVTQSEQWIQLQVSAPAPVGAASVRGGFVGSVSSDGDIRFDDATWDATSSLTGLMFKAVQPEIGTSDDIEPVWPSVLGVQVIDNTVIWEAVSLSRVVWQARPILVSGPTEPVWPTVPGERVTDNTISWEVDTQSIDDPNCPDSDIVVIGASKVHVGDDDIDRFCATTNPLDWTTQEDAGFLGVGLQQYGANPISAMGLYRSNLVVFNAEAFQMWQIDEDPENMALLDALPIGSTRHNALCPVSGDLFFLSSQGVRTVGIAGGSTNLQAGDVGMPIDPLVLEALVVMDAAGLEAIALYYPAAGQYWLMLPDGEGGTQAFVYTMTRVGQVGAWSRYLLPYEVVDWAIKGDDLYLRAGDKVFRVNDDLIGDKLTTEGPATLFSGVVWWPWLDFGAPGVTKRMLGVDSVSDGAPTIEIGYDQSAQGVFTAPYQLPADTVPGMIVPMEVSAPSFSVRLTWDGSTKWHFRALNVYLADNRMMS